jgi:hypothetical protein
MGRQQVCPLAAHIPTKPNRVCAELSLNFLKDSAGKENKERIWVVDKSVIKHFWEIVGKFGAQV